MTGAQSQTGEISHARAVFYLVVTAILWSSGGVLIKSISWDGITTAGMRSLVAALALYGVARRHPVRNVRVVLLGALAYALTLSTFVVATKLTTAANAIVLQYTAPFYVALLSFPLLGERIGQRDWMAIGLAFFGMVLCFSETLSATGLLGNTLALVSGLLYALTILLLRHQKSQHPVQIAFFGNIVAFLLCSPWLTFGTIQGTDLAIILWLGIVQIALPYFLYAAALKRVTAIEAATIPVLEPVLNPLWVALMVGEIPGSLTLIGGAIVIAAVVLRSLPRTPERHT